MPSHGEARQWAGRAAAGMGPGQKRGRLLPGKPAAARMPPKKKCRSTAACVCCLPGKGPIGRGRRLHRFGASGRAFRSGQPPPGRPALPPFRTRGACPVDRWVEVFFPLRGRRPPPFGVRGAAAHWRPFSCARPGPARGKTVRPKAEKQGESQRTAKDRGEPAAGRKKNRERTARAQNGVQRRFGAHGRQRIWLPRAADA